MGYILLTRNPSNGQLLVANDENGNIVEYNTEEAADKEVETLPAFKTWGFVILEVEL